MSVVGLNSSDDKSMFTLFVTTLDKLSNFLNHFITEKRARTVVLMGKTGVGKSSLANTLFGETQLFKTNDLPNSETMITQTETWKINGSEFKLVDTPGVFGTDQNDQALSGEILKGVKECQGGIDTYFFVFKVTRFTPQEQKVVKKILKYTSEEAFKHAILVFTHGNQLQEGTSIKVWADGNEYLKTLVEKCEDRVVVFDNKHWNNSKDPYRNNQVQREKLFNFIETTIRDNGGIPCGNAFSKLNLTDKNIESLKKVKPEHLWLALVGGIIIVALIAVPVVVVCKLSLIHI